MLRIRTLGVAEIEVENLSIRPTSPRKFALLLRLAAEPGRSISRASLRELLFPEQADANGRHSVREAVYQLRRSGIKINTEDDGVTIASDYVESDYGLVLAGGRPSLEQLDAIERGFLPGYSPDHSETFNEWLEGFRAKTTLALSRALLNEMARFKIDGDWAGAERAARACLALDQMNEEATLVLAESLAINGAKIRAVRLLDEYLGEVKSRSPELRIPAELLRRRITERVQSDYSTRADRRFVGRATEMRFLSECLAVVRAGGTRCVVLEGEAGIGKTRLASEFATRSALLGCYGGRVALQPLDRQRPMSAFVELVPQLLELPGALGCSPESMSVLRTLTRHDLTSSGPIPANAAQSSRTIAAQVSAAIADLVDAVTSECTLVVTIDDAQWLDDVSRGMIRSLSTRTDAHRLLLIVSTRPDRGSGVFRDPESYFPRIRLSPLEADACTSLLRDVFPGQSPEDDSLREWMRDAARGNPFFLDSLIGHYQSTHERFAVPPQLSSLIDQRLSLLPSLTTQVLCSAVALGRYATLPRLMAVVDLPTIALLEAVQELEEKHLIANGKIIGPAHWLISEGVSRRRTPVATRIIHSRIAPILEKDAKESRDAGMMWACAEHWVLADETARAALMFRSCADHAVGIGRAREGAELLLRAASFTEGTPRTLLIEAAIRTASTAAEIDVVLRAVKVLERPILGSPHDDIEIALLNALAFSERENAVVLQRLQTCVSEASAPDEHRLAAGITLMIWSDQKRDVQLATWVYRQLSSPLSASDDENAMLRHKCLLIYHSSFGEINEASAIAQILRKIALSSDDHVAADLTRKAAVGLWRAGRSDDAFEAYTAAFRTGAASGSYRLQYSIAMSLAGHFLDFGNSESTEAWLTIAEGLRASISDTRTDFFDIPILAEIALARGDDEVVCQLAHDAFAHGLHTDQRGKRWCRALSIFARHARGDSVDWDVEVAEVGGERIAGFEAGDVADFETAVVALALVDFGDTDRARTFVQEYFDRYRRGRTPLSAALIRAIRASGACSLPQWVDSRQSDRVRQKDSEVIERNINRSKTDHLA